MSEDFDVTPLDDIAAWRAHDGQVIRLLICPKCGAVVNQSSVGMHWDWHKGLDE